MKPLRYAARFWEEDGVWYAEIPSVNGGTLTQGYSPEEARHMAQDAVSLLLASRVFDLGKEPDPADEVLPEGHEWVQPYAKVEMATGIRQERRAAGLTMQQAADRVGVALGTYPRWENPDRCNATAETLSKLAAAFGKRLQVQFV